MEFSVVLDSGNVHHFFATRVSFALDSYLCHTFLLSFCWRILSLRASVLSFYDSFRILRISILRIGSFLRCLSFLTKGVGFIYTESDFLRLLYIYIFPSDLQVYKYQVYKIKVYKVYFIFQKMHEVYAHVMLFHRLCLPRPVWCLDSRPINILLSLTAVYMLFSRIYYQFYCLKWGSVFPRDFAAFRDFIKLSHFPWVYLTLSGLDHRQRQQIIGSSVFLNEVSAHDCTLGLDGPFPFFI